MITPNPSPAKTGNTLASENIKMFLQTPVYDSSVPRMPESSGPSKLPSYLPAQFGSIGSFCQTMNAPFSTSDKAPLRSKPSMDKDDSLNFWDKNEVMAAMRKMRAQHDK